MAKHDICLIWQHSVDGWFHWVIFSACCDCISFSFLFVFCFSFSLSFSLRTSSRKIPVDKQSPRWFANVMVGFLMCIFFVILILLSVCALIYSYDLKLLCFDLNLKLCSRACWGVLCVLCLIKHSLHCALWCHQLCSTTRFFSPCHIVMSVT